MRTRQLRSLATVLAVLAMCIGTAASAVVLQGRGELHAMGSGVAVFEMRGVLTVRGGGVLIVEDDVRIETEGRGRTTSLGDGRVLYEGYGRAVIASPDPTRIKIAGAKIRLHAKGAGRAFLKGCGVIHTDDLHEAWERDPELSFDSGD